jgi:Phosphate transport (Pho88)
VLLWIRTQIQQRNDLTKLSVPQKPALGSTEKTYKEMTRVEYELGELKSALNNLLIGTLIVCGIHFYFGLIPPVIISSIQGVTGLLTNPLYQIYIGGKEVKAPFAEEEGMFEGLKKEWKGLAKMVKTGEIPDEKDDDKSGSGGAPNSKAERRAALLKERKEAKKNKAN